ncbi:MAG: ketoacyl-ACP synthase III [Firmicutes bacterium]|nr:ketoacyl-ACP synthase III [Bacillota bacterium]
MGLHSVSIIGTGSYLPSTVVTNADMEKLVDTNDEWIFSRTGIRERRKMAPEETVTDMAVAAARKAIAAAGIDPKEIGLIVAASFTADLNFPPLAAMVQREIGAVHAAAFDTNAVCAGFLFALVQGSQFLQTGAYKTALIVAAEGLTRFVDYTDRNSCILFGDGAGAAVLQGGDAATDGPLAERTGFIDFDLGSDGSRVGVAFCPRPNAPEAWLATLSDRESVTPYIWQDGRAMFKAAVNGMADSVRRIMARQQLASADIDVLVPHQANLRIIEAVGDRVGVPIERVALCLEEYGNTSAASMAITLDKWTRLGRIQPGQLVMFTAFAGGLSWGSALFRM